jgi:FkbM family methyltransferase
MTDAAAEFTPYVVRDRKLGPISYDFWITDPIAAQWYGGPDHMMPEKGWCLSHLRPGMVALDCGAHHGQMTLMFAKAVGPKGHVFAWEVLPQNAAVIERNVALNGLRNVTVRPVGLGARREWVAFERNSNNVMVTAAAAAAAGDERIEVVPLDEDLPAGQRVDFLKVDVEGADLAALQGARGVLRQHPILDLELHTFAFQDAPGTLAAICDLLAPLPYRYALLADILGNPEDIGTRLDPARLALTPNPHLLAVPL